MKKLFWIVLVIGVLTFASLALADDGLGAMPAATSAPLTPEALACEAVRKELPTAVIQYVLQDRDDGRLEWNLFFTNGNTIGEYEVDGETYAVRKSRIYDMPANALTADQAIAQLAKSKGDVTILELELERDDGKLFYEGSVELDGKRYDFEMTLEGRLVDWERD